MNFILGFVIAVILAKLGVQLALNRLNRTAVAAQRDQVPTNLQGVVTAEDHQRSASYTLEHNRLGSQETIYGAFLKIFILTAGVIPWVYNGTVLAFGAENYWALALMMSLVGMVVSMFYWPFEWVATFGIEARYGFNRQTPLLWLADTLKNMALGIVLTVPVMALVMWMASGAILNWWLWAFMVVLIYEVILTFLYPSFIEPLFNKFTPLPPGPLKERLEALAQRAHISISQILVMDASRRSHHANAYFAGIGRSRRIVLYDTLIQQLSIDEVEAVVAHEIGHMKHQHTLRQMYVGSAWQLVAFCIVDQLIRWEAFYNAFGLTSATGVAGAFFILSFIGGAFSFWFTPVMSRWYRRHEYQADAMAVALVGGPTPLITGLKKLTSQSLASIEDHPASQAWYAAHPTLRQREEEMLHPSQRWVAASLRS